MRVALDYSNDLVEDSSTHIRKLLEAYHEVTQGHDTTHTLTLTYSLIYLYLAAHAPTHTNTHSNTLTHTYTHSHSLSHSHSRQSSPAHTHTHSHTLITAIRSQPLIRSHLVYLYTLSLFIHPLFHC